MTQADDLLGLTQQLGAPLGGAAAGLAGGALTGAGVGLLGGPFAEITVPAGALVGAGLGAAGGFFGGLFSQNHTLNSYQSQQAAIASASGAQAQQAVTQRAGILAMLPGANAALVAGAVAAPVTTTTTTTSNLSTPSWVLPLAIGIGALAVVYVVMKK